MFLETRNGREQATFTVHSAAGIQAVDSQTRTSLRRKTPSQLRRDTHCLELFQKAKSSGKEVQETNTKNGTEALGKQVLVQLTDKELPQETPIPQLDGMDDYDKVGFNFKSDYAEEDVIDTLDEIFPDKNVVTSIVLVSRVRIEDRSSTHDCKVELTVPTSEKHNFAWPELTGMDAKVIENVKMVYK